MRFRAWVSLLSAILLLVALPTTVSAATSGSTPPKERGLLITPTQQELKVNAGATTRKGFVVANLTEKPITIDFSVKEFSVANYTYDYQFTNPHSDWLKLGLTQITLASNKSQTIPYSITPDATAAPGGYYYTLFASSTLTGGLNTTVQAASLLYVTINGKLIQTGQLQKASIQRVVFGKEVDYKMDAVDTGNVYYTASVYGKLHGLFTKPQATAIGHILIPQKVRTLNGSIPSPLLPGIYRATFGYITDDGTHIEQARWIIYIPFWFLAIIVGLALVVNGWRGKRGPKKPAKPATKSTDTSKSNN